LTLSDGWVSGEAYESYMGRWSRQVASLFLDWLNPAPGLHWLDLGCGTGALAQAICRHSPPSSLVGCDPSPGLVSFARASVTDCPATFVVAGVENLPGRDGGFDIIVSGLVLNFLPDPLQAIRSMRERLHPGAMLAAYVWDYAAGMQFLHIFWEEAALVDPTSTRLDEALRFPICHPDHLAGLWHQAGLDAVETTLLEIDTTFSSFDDFWSPFLSGTGPAPAYLAGLDAARQSQLVFRLRERLGSSTDGSIHLKARAYGVRGDKNV
jgi:trans-aconitate methyltransferase